MIDHYLIGRDYSYHLLFVAVDDNNDLVDQLDVDDIDKHLVVERQWLEEIIEHELVVELNVIVELNSFHVLTNKFWILFEQVLVSLHDFQLLDVSFPKYKTIFIRT